MIVVDSSAIVAIARREDGFESLGGRMVDGPAVVGAPTLIQVKMALSTLPDAIPDQFIGRLVAAGLEPVPFSSDMADAAVTVFRRYGKGQRHPERLSFEDCVSYAVAKTLKPPLLFKGDDFGHTDIAPALP